MKKEVEGRQQPAKISLGLLPSGPDPVGEHNACANLPIGYMGAKSAQRNPQGKARIPKDSRP
jgi:hypothetical protein